MGEKKQNVWIKKFEKDHAVLRGIILTGVSEISANSAESHKYVLLVGTNKENFNPFVSNAPFLYPLETSENRYFQGVENGCIGNKWVKQKKKTDLKETFIKIYKFIEFSGNRNFIEWVRCV